MVSIRNNEGLGPLERDYRISPVIISIILIPRAEPGAPGGTLKEL